MRVAFVIGDYPEAEFRRRERAALAYASPEVEIGILRTPASPFVHGLTPAERQMLKRNWVRRVLPSFPTFWLWTESRCS